MKIISCDFQFINIIFKCPLCYIVVVVVYTQKWRNLTSRRLIKINRLLSIAIAYLTDDMYSRLGSNVRDMRYKVEVLTNDDPICGLFKNSFVFDLHLPPFRPF